MPVMNGLELLKELQKLKVSAKIMMASTDTREGAQTTLDALELGALDFVHKPNSALDCKNDTFKARFLDVLDAVASSKAPAFDNSAFELSKIKSSRKLVEIVQKHATSVRGSKVVAIASSTGGPKALQSVIPRLPKNLNAPVVLVQHMPAGFTKSMADRLNEISPIAVKEAEEGDVLQKGHVYIAPGGKHMEVKKNPDGTHKIVLNDMPAIGGLKPCANITFDSISNTGFDEIICVVLTGMGADGTNGILSLCQHKPVHVIAQNAETCVVYGMPKAIAEAGVVDEVVSLKDVAKTITKNVGVK